MREFKTAAKQANHDTMEFKIDDDVLVSLRPTESQLVTFMATQVSDLRSEGEQIASFIDFADAIMEPEAKRYIQRRLFDREDPFDHEALSAIVMGLIEEWSQRPTKPLSGSTTSPENGGTPSVVDVPVTESTSLPAPQQMPALSSTTG